MHFATFNNNLYFKKLLHVAQKGSKFHYFVNFDYIRRLIETIS